MGNSNGKVIFYFDNLMFGAFGMHGYISYSDISVFYVQCDSKTNNITFTKFSDSSFSYHVPLTTDTTLEIKNYFGNEEYKRYLLENDTNGTKLNYIKSSITHASYHNFQDHQQPQTQHNLDEVNYFIKDNDAEFIPPSKRIHISHVSPITNAHSESKDLETTTKRPNFIPDPRYLKKLPQNIIDVFNRYNVFSEDYKILYEIAQSSAIPV